MAERFQAVVRSEGTGTFIEVPLDVPAVFGRVRARVQVTVNGWTWRAPSCATGSATTCR